MDGAHGRANLNLGVVDNAEAIIEHRAQFDWYVGGGIDVAFLGLAQTDRRGEVNVSRFGSRAMGVGGFVNISQAAKTLVYCGTFHYRRPAGRDRRRRAAHPPGGAPAEFIDYVGEVKFSGEQVTGAGRPVLHVPERAVFELRAGRMTLIERPW